MRPFPPWSRVQKYFLFSCVAEYFGSTSVDVVVGLRSTQKVVAKYSREDFWLRTGNRPKPYIAQENPLTSTVTFSRWSTQKNETSTHYIRNMRRIYIDRYNYALRLSSFFFFIFLSRFLFFSFVACRSKRFHTNQSKTVNFFKTDLLNQENKSRSPALHYCHPLHPSFTSACYTGYLFRFLTTWIRLLP